MRVTLYPERSGMDPGAAVVTLDKSYKLILVQFPPLESTENNGTYHTG